MLFTTAKFTALLLAIAGSVVSADASVVSRVSIATMSRIPLSAQLSFRLMFLYIQEELAPIIKLYESPKYGGDFLPQEI